MKKIPVVAILATALLCYACNGNYQAAEEKEAVVTDITNYSPPSSENQLNGMDEAPDETPPDKFKQQLPKPTAGTEKDYSNWDRKVIRTAEVSTEVEDLQSYTQFIRSGIRQLGGYVAGEVYASTEYRRSSEITLKIPVHLFEEGMKLVSEKATEIKAINISSQDVSTETVDLKARLEVRGKMRDRYLQLMSGAKNMDELLKVQHEVQGLQEEIESGSSRLNYLNQAAAMSTIRLSSSQVLKPGDEPKAEPETNPIGSAFLTGWGMLRDLILALLTVWPLLLGVLLLWVFLKKRGALKTIKAE